MRRILHCIFDSSFDLLHAWRQNRNPWNAKYKEKRKSDRWNSFKNGFPFLFRHLLNVRGLTECHHQSQPVHCMWTVCTVSGYFWLGFVLKCEWVYSLLPFNGYIYIFMHDAEVIGGILSPSSTFDIWLKSKSRLKHTTSLFMSIFYGFVFVRSFDSISASVHSICSYLAAECLLVFALSLSLSLFLCTQINFVLTISL